ncbi:hypothetical protein [Sphaerisporangium corydalis]|uniref:DUF1795 domain-containing protein n=1 Tax=Sphaerisporangium corydalis TaxID=1441875 RepID=A0ABV9EII6_9ACTN|nr:hypothetical protein [Sphaerisporangium corydalis]
MDEHWTERRPYGDHTWPAPQEEGLPPSARLYGAPAPPSRVRMPSWLRRALVLVVGLAAGVAVVAGAVALVMSRLNAPGPPVDVVDTAAGVSYPVPEGWRRGTVPPVTGFTSVAGADGAALVMSRPGESVDVSGPRAAAIDLADLYSRLLLHGDTVDVVDDRTVSAGGFTGHSRALRASYTDVVNQPSYLRVTLLTKDGRTVVLLGMAQPDDPRRRAEIDAVLKGVR